MRNLIPKKEAREPISTPIEPHNRPFGAEKLTRADVQQRPRSEAQAKMFENAKAHLANLTTASATAYIATLPIALLECYLLAEEDAQNREIILRRFPKPGPLARQRFLTEEPKRGSKLLDLFKKPDAQNEDN